jgi:hypothetical protein
MDTKFTTMSQQAIGDAIQSASAAGNPQLEPVHLLASLLTQERGVAVGLLDAVGANAQAIGQQVRAALVALPQASGSSTAQPSASRARATSTSPPSTCSSRWPPASRPRRRSCPTPGPPPTPCAPPCPPSAARAGSPAPTRRARTRRSSSTAPT